MSMGEAIIGLMVGLCLVFLLWQWLTGDVSPQLSLAEFENLLLSAALDSDERQEGLITAGLSLAEEVYGPGMGAAWAESMRTRLRRERRRISEQLTATQILNYEQMRLKIDRSKQVDFIDLRRTRK